MGGIKEFLGFGGNKGVDCEDDTQTGNKSCRVITRHRNSLLATGTQFSGGLDKSCKFHFTERSTILDDDEPEVAKAVKRMESDCRGGIN